MPLPKPRKGEKQSDFISRCIEFETKASPGRDPKQIQAMCYTAWKNRNKESAPVSGLREITCLPDNCLSEAVIDATSDHPIIKNITILGSESKNKRKYLRAAMENAVDLYDGVKVFANHQEEGGLFTSGTPDVMKLAGRITNPRFEEETLKIRGDFHGLPGDSVADKFMNIARNMPEIAGFSHNAQGKVRVEKGIEIIEEIKAVYSVDLVAYPATNVGMFEHENTEIETMEWADITLEELKKNRPDLTTALISKGAASRDDEVNTITKERDDALKEADELKVANALAEKTAMVDNLLAQSDLPPEAKTEVFRKTLQNLTVPEGKELKDVIAEQIDDRMAAVTGKTPVRNHTERHHTEDSKEMDDDEALSALRSQ